MLSILNTGSRITILLGALLPVANVASCYTPTATTRNGTYVGIFNANYSEDEFLGIPYARPPVGDLRFRAPESLNSSWDEARNATAYSPIVGSWTLRYDVQDSVLTSYVL